MQSDRAPSSTLVRIREPEPSEGSLLPIVPRLPPELTDLVIDFLRDDIYALANCSLTCRAWLPRARLHKFRLVRFTPRSYSGWKRSFKAARLADRKLVRLVRELSIENIGSGRLKMWNDAALRDIVCHFPDVTKLSLAHDDLYFYDAFDRITQLKSLRLYNYLIPNLAYFTKMMTTLPHLEELSLIDVSMNSVTDQPEAPQTFIVHGPPLKRLEVVRSLGNSDYLAFLLQHYSMCSHMKSLALLPMPLGSMDVWGRSIRMMGSLEHLKLSMVQELEVPLEPMDGKHSPLLPGNPL